MTQEASTAVPLPQTHILSYLSTATTPTRVRRVASIAVLVLGILMTIGAALVLTSYAYDVHRRYTQLVRIGLMIGRPIGPRHYLESLLDPLGSNPPLYFLVLPWLSSPLLLFLPRRIYRGAPAACLIARHYLLLPLFELLLVAAIFLGWGIVMGLPFQGALAQPEYLLFLLSLPLWVLPALLLIDLRTFLKWIIRNPSTEKPPASFLPGAKLG